MEDERNDIINSRKIKRKIVGKKNGNLENKIHVITSMSKKEGNKRHEEF